MSRGIIICGVFIWLLTIVGENIIATTKIRNNYVAFQSSNHLFSNIAIAIVVRATTIGQAIQKRSHEPIYKTHTKF